MDSALLIFARAPEPGQVKTRLIPALGEEGACRLYQQLTQQVLNAVVDGEHYMSYLVCQPDNTHAFFKELRDRYNLLLSVQRGFDLGERMLNAITESLKTHTKALVIGTDCPRYSRAYIDRAVTSLGEADVVLGPASDGGYVLIGMKQPIPELFQSIPWGSDRVFERTVRNLEKLGLSYKLLPVLHDIDIPSDLRHLQEPM